MTEIYNHWRDEYSSNRVGHICGNFSYAAGAALLLLLPGRSGDIGSGETPPIPVQTAESKIVSCPHCGAKCRVPGGNGRVQITCPNPNCKIPFTFDS